MTAIAEDVGALHLFTLPMRLSMALDSPLLLVLDEAVDSETCEKIISLSSRRAPQEIPVTDEAAGTSTLKRKFPVTSSSWMAAAPSEAVQAEEAALQTVTTLVMEMLQSQTTEAETPPNVHCTEPSAASGLTLGLHVDTNMKPDRFATALLYLRDVPAGGGGETIFPLGEDSMHPHPLASAAQRLLDCECTHTRPEPELEPAAARLCAAASALAGMTSDSAEGLFSMPSRGAVVQPRAGRLLIFFTRLDDGEVDHTSWHGGADVTDSGGKWTLQYFKEVPKGVDVAEYVRERRTALAARFGVGS